MSTILRATQTFQASSVTDTAGDVPLTLAAGYRTLPGITLTNTATSEPGYNYPLSNASSVRYVKVLCITNYGDPTYIGLDFSRLYSWHPRSRAGHAGVAGRRAWRALACLRMEEAEVTW